MNSLDRVTRELVQVSCLECLRYFKFTLRGREELVVTAKDVLIDPITMCTSNDALSPASPRSQEIMFPSPRDSLFIVGAFKKYGRPTVWLRDSNLGDDHNSLDLPSAVHWESTVFPIAAILSDIAQRLYPQRNPLEVDFTAINALSDAERVIVVSGLLQYLKDVIASQPWYMDAVWQDIERLVDVHAELLIN